MKWHPGKGNNTYPMAFLYTKACQQQKPHTVPPLPPILQGFELPRFREFYHEVEAGENSTDPPALLALLLGPAGLTARLDSRSASLSLVSAAEEALSAQVAAARSMVDSLHTAVLTEDLPGAAGAAAAAGEEPLMVVGADGEEVPWSPGCHSAGIKVQVFWVTEAQGPVYR